jgi:hypothetical protein
MSTDTLTAKLLPLLGNRPACAGAAPGCNKDGCGGHKVSVLPGWFRARSAMAQSVSRRDEILGIPCLAHEKWAIAIVPAAAYG